MEKKRVLVQDIADSLNLSRTTVSKVLNGNAGVSAKTRDRVLKKAVELNYKHISDFSKSPIFSVKQESSDPINGNIALLYHKFPDKQHSGSSVLTVVEKNISRQGYTLSLYSISDQDLLQCRLPGTLQLNFVDAIFCIEVFDKKYCQMLSELNKPTLFLDSYPNISEDHLYVDLLISESKNTLAAMVRSLIRQYHLKSVGFVGAFTHCFSFHERWLGFCMALYACGLTVDSSLCITEQDDAKYWDSAWMMQTLRQMKPLPELFVCANDALAIQLISCLKRMQLSVPEDILVTGFDNSPASCVVGPSLTTIDCHNEELGIIAAKQLTDRIQNPDLPYTETFIQSEILYRDSTNRRK